VLAIEPRRDDGGDEELGAVSVWASICHREQARSGVLSLEVLVCKFLAVDRLATSAITTGEVSSLQHELWDDAMELAALVSESLLASAKSTEVLSSFGDYIVVELEVDAGLLGLLVVRGGVLDVEVSGHAHVGGGGE